jgi:hypothetical protein
MKEGLFEEQLQARASMVERIRRDLSGPVDPDEVLEEPPLDKYMIGILYPKIVESQSPELADGDNQDDLADDDAGGGPADPAVAMSNVQYPTSAGISFAVDSAVEDLQVEVTASRYAESDAGWVRNEISIPPIRIELAVGTVETLDLGDGLSLYSRVREPLDGAVSVTVVVINGREARSGKKDSECFFQVSFTVRGTEKGSNPFVARPSPLSIQDEDLESNALLYRNIPEFAVGHGCAGDWQVSDEPTRATSVSGVFIPEYDVTLLESNRDVDDSNLAFSALAETDQHDLVAKLEAFAAGYAEWIERVREESTSLDDRYQETAAKHLAECRQVRERIVAGIHVLRDDSRALRAFRLANRAMADQMMRPDPEAAAARPAPKWRPFQLAFVLLSIPSITDRGHPDRDLVELLWFPTGGGKTEAYLGLFAYAVFLRRIEDPTAGGVTALMRYTLRLLTIQQFSRAARVICSCELIRRSEGDLGDEPISIGLFVGRASTPNSIPQAQEALKGLRAGKTIAESNPCQLSSCPWCDSVLDHTSYTTHTDPDRLKISCRNRNCDFSKAQEGLPVYVVDQDLYRLRPTLVIGTVDKFAGLPWDPRIGLLLNSGTGDPPPELIIQDELHLISGPLGTMAALYETAVDLICADQGASPKIVSSTATIRRAKAQSLGLFARSVSQFPPPGIDPGNSWFAVEADPDRVGSRKYLGLMAPGTSHSSLMIRAYASLLNGANRLPPGPGTDPYWTLIGYFNSLRVLGAARMQVQDDVQDWLAILAGEGPMRELGEPVELTSRAQSTDIPEYLDRMEVAMPDPEALDVVLATNMISVGVDVDRLGLMAVMGQPQASAEYIQSTSRVGRKHPGLVVTILNAARSRDRSHYEGFRGFHSSLYRSVEATSVTPFSPRARDRGLHAVLIALARLGVDGLGDNDDAGRAAEFRQELEKIRDKIVARVSEVEPDQEKEVNAELNTIIEHWISLAANHRSLVYQKEEDSQVPLLTEATPEAMATTTDPYSTMRSLRDVDVESELVMAGLR